VPVENSILFFTALHALEIPVEMHIYPVGGHGLGLASEETQSYEYQNAVREECQSWISLALSWMQHLKKYPRRENKDESINCSRYAE
jgi:dipeptidyl aminopeptidase/acylaminoacyl peptidase